MRALFLQALGLVFIILAFSLGDTLEQLIVWQTCMVCGLIAICAGHIVSAIKDGNNA